MSYKLHATSLVAFLMLITAGMFAQSIERQVIGSAGTVFTNNNVSMSFTIGETKVSSYNNGTHWLTEGFQQGFFDPISSLDQIDMSDIGVTLYPNPFTDEFSIEFEEGDVEDFEIMVLNMLGDLVHVNRTNLGNKINLSLDGHSTGIYFVKVHKDEKLLKTIKINKVLF